MRQQWELKYIETKASGFWFCSANWLITTLTFDYSTQWNINDNKRAFYHFLSIDYRMSRAPILHTEVKLAFLDNTASNMKFDKVKKRNNWAVKEKSNLDHIKLAPVVFTSKTMEEKCLLYEIHTHKICDVGHFFRLGHNFFLLSLRIAWHCVASDFPFSVHALILAH